MLTLLVAAVVLSLLDHFDCLLRVLVVKRLCGRRASSSEIPLALENRRARPTLRISPLSITARVRLQGKFLSKP